MKLFRSFKNKSSFSLGKRLTYLFFLTNSCTIAFAFVVFTLVQVSFSFTSFLDELKSVSTVVASSSRASIAFNDIKSANRILGTLLEKDNVVFAILAMPNAESFAEVGRTPENFELSQAPDKHIFWSLHFLQIDTPVTLDGEQLGTLTIVAKLTTFYRQFALMVLFGIIVTIAAGSATYFFSRLLSLWVLKPVEKLKELAHEVSLTQNFNRRLEPMREEEFNELLNALNYMLEQLKERDDSLRHAKEIAETANNTKSRFIANVSHELRTPLHAILGMTDELLGSHLSIEQQDLLSTVKDAGNSLLSIINDILDFSKIDAGKLSLNKAPFQLKDFVLKTLKIFEHSFQSKGITLEYEIKQNVPAAVITDKGRLSQILVNILGNALKFTNNGGAVKLTVEVKENGEKAAPHLFFTVQDTGIGIPQDKLSSIFESFVQVGSKSDPTKGTGLGLAIVDRLIKLLNGSIYVESKEGQGSTFSFSIEFDRASGARDEKIRYAHQGDDASLLSPAEQDALKRHNSQFKILIVEDNIVNQKLLQLILEKQGFVVIVAANGQRCLDIIHSDLVSLIIMDVNMPIMDGLTATSLIRSRESDFSAHLPIIGLTAQVGNDCEQACKEAGMDVVLTKPLSKSALMKEVRRLLTGYFPPTSAKIDNVRF